MDKTQLPMASIFDIGVPLQCSCTPLVNSLGPIVDISVMVAPMGRLINIIRHYTLVHGFCFFKLLFAFFLP